MSWFSDIWQKLVDFLSKLWEELKPILAIAAIALALYFLGGGALTLFGLTFQGTGAAVAALVGAFIIDSETTTEVLTDVAEAVTDVATVIAEGVGSVVGSTLSGFAKSPAGLALLGLGAYMLLSGDDDGPKALTNGSETDNGDPAAGLIVA